MEHTTKRWISIAALGVILFVSGCADLGGALNKAAAWRDNAQTLETDLSAQLDSLNTQRQSTPDISPDAPPLDALILETQAKIQILGALIAQADLVIEEAKNPSDTLTQAADALSPWVPAPAQGPLVLGAALIATMIRSRNLKNNTTSIIKSIEHTMKNDPAFKNLFTQHADTIRTIQTPGARKLIDKTLTRSTKPILPI
jgi:hypothetical protein